MTDKKTHKIKNSYNVLISFYKINNFQINTNAATK